MQAQSPDPSSSLARIPRLGLVLLLGVLMNACASLSPGQLARVYKTHWRLIALEEEPQPFDEPILLRIEERKQLFGQMNSSRYFGSYEAGSQGSFRVLNLAPIQGISSKSPAPEVLRYLSLILLVDRMGIDRQGQLVLRSGGRELLRFEDSLLLRAGPAPEK